MVDSKSLHALFLGEENNETEPGMWEETFGGHTDSKPNGPSAVAMDFTFPGEPRAPSIPRRSSSQEVTWKDIFIITYYHKHLYLVPLKFKITLPS